MIQGASHDVFPCPEVVGHSNWTRSRLIAVQDITHCSRSTLWEFTARSSETISLSTSQDGSLPDAPPKPFLGGARQSSLPINDVIRHQHIQLERHLWRADRCCPPAWGPGLGPLTA